MQGRIYDQTANDASDEVGGSVVRWLAGAFLRGGFACSPPCLCGLPLGAPAFLPQPKDTQVRSTGYSKLPYELAL